MINDDGKTGDDADDDDDGDGEEEVTESEADEDEEDEEESGSGGGGASMVRCSMACAVSRYLSTRGGGPSSRGSWSLEDWERDAAAAAAVLLLSVVVVVVVVVLAEAALLHLAMILRSPSIDRTKRSPPSPPPLPSVALQVLVTVQPACQPSRSSRGAAKTRRSRRGPWAHPGSSSWQLRPGNWQQGSGSNWP